MSNEQIRPLRLKPAICNLCRDLRDFPGATEQICRSKQTIEEAIEEIINPSEKENGEVRVKTNKNITDLELLMLLGEDPGNENSNGLVSQEYICLKTNPAVDEAIKSGKLHPSRIRICLKYLVEGTYKKYASQCNYPHGYNPEDHLAGVYLNSHIPRYASKNPLFSVNGSYFH